MASESNVEFLTPPSESWSRQAADTRFIVDDPSISYRWKTVMIDRKRAEETSEFLQRDELIKAHNLKFTGEQTDRAVHPLPMHHFEPFFASGHAFVSSLSDSLICQEIFRSYTLEVLMKMICGDGVGQLFQIALPPNFEGKTYLEMFRWLTYRNVLPLGLYRAAQDDEPAYVFTNPPRDTVLRAKDRVFVLASAEPSEEIK